MSAAADQSIERFLPVGAEYRAGRGVSFRVWAPKRKQVDVVFKAGNSITLTSEPDGYFSGIVRDARPDTQYQFRLDADARLLPDPISRYQPEGVHGPSEVMDPSMFKWKDLDWRGITAQGQVLYELHIGTFTAEGTWAAASERLAELKELGITCIEMMPIAEFPGEFGWGYDGVALFAPTRAYGSPDDLRRFIDAAHALQIGVILDVVYNHLGPDGNYLKEFSNSYFTAKHANDWGESLNFDDTSAAGVREYFISNARYWITEYHFDGFRFDATQAILDSSPTHILAEISIAARAAAGKRSIYLITENEPQLTQIVRPVAQGGYGMDALWNDDFHHSAMVALTGRSEAYFTDYHGSPQEFISACKYGYLFQGQISAWQMLRRGTSALDLPANAFVNYIQNHDQIANYGHGDRAHQLAGMAEFKAMTVLLLLSPQTPMLFQGQEFAASNPFLYFADHSPELCELIRKGRLKELSQFPSNSHPDMQAMMCEPGNRETFLRCKLDWKEREHGSRAAILKLHKRLLELRRTDPAFNRSIGRGELDGAVIGPDAFVLRYFWDSDRLILINLGNDLNFRALPEPLLAAPAGMRWDIMLSTESPEFGGCGVAPFEPLDTDWRLPGVNYHLPGRCAIVMKPTPLTAAEQTRFNEVQQKRLARRISASEGS